MPSKKKAVKSRAELTAENFFPINEDNLKHTIEKKVKEISKSEIEIIEKTSLKKKGLKKEKTTPKIKKKFFSKKSTAKISIENYEPEKIELKKSGYELIITEKPQAAMKIASALGKAEKRNFHGVPYYEVEKNGKKIMVGCAVGHLFTLKQTANGVLPIFNVKWVPNSMVLKNDFTKKYADTLSKLVKQAGSLIVATDYDTEGEVIGMNIVRYIAGQKDAYRMKFSTLTSKELQEAYEKKSHTLNWGQAIAGEVRHYLDWFYGINLSRALMNSIKSAGSFKIMSIGRVQGPALNLIVKKEREIQSFKSSTYWNVYINVKDKDAKTAELKYIRDITKKQELEKFKNLEGKDAEAETKKSQQTLQPLEPFNLTSLQTEAYKLYGLTPSKTLQIAQSLYLAGLISYPRTSSQKLPASIAYKEILEKIARKFNAEKFLSRKTPIEGSKSDPAHPSIYPTGHFESLIGEEEKVYNLVARRFLALFCDDALLDNKNIKVTAKSHTGEDLIFTARGTSIAKEGWTKIYPFKITEKSLPDLEGKVKILKVKTEEKLTQPPKRYSPASIITELEKRNLGTKATRASIVETLFDRGYVKDKSIEATPLGISLISTLEKYSPIIIDEKLTRHFETEMNQIQDAKKSMHEKEEKIIEEAKSTITKIIEHFNQHEQHIGKALVEANNEVREQEREANTLQVCPVCKKNNLRILFNKAWKRYFVACSGYPECKTTFSLPPNGLIKKADDNKVCKECGWPMVMRLSKGKRPWEFCFNPKCPTRAEYEKRKKEKEN